MMNIKWTKVKVISVIIIGLILLFLIFLPQYSDRDPPKEETTTLERSEIEITGAEDRAAPVGDDGWIDEESSYEKKVHYGTTRVDKCSSLTNSAEKCNKNPKRLDTGNERTLDSIKYGIVKVNIPYAKKIGGTAGMSLLSLNHDIGWEAFKVNLKSEDLLVFIHGYNTSFSSAAIRSAQLAHDTNFQGEAVLFSWPSKQSIRPITNYMRDKKRAIENFSFAAEFLVRLSANTDKDIHIVAHSMGNYILTNALAIIDEKIKSNDYLLKSRRDKRGGKIFAQIILASPDIAKDEYELKHLQHGFEKLSDRITLYSAINDYVLSASRIVNRVTEGNGEVRLGKSSEHSKDNFTVIEGMDTVDTRQEISPQFFGHSFYAEYRGLVSDMHLLLNYGAHPDSRMLQKVIDSNDQHVWFLRD